MFLAPGAKLDAPESKGSGAFVGVPSMSIDLEVKVLSEADRSDRSEPQGAVREGGAESSGEQDLWGDE
jgi:hypothetical protein